MLALADDIERKTLLTIVRREAMVDERSLVIQAKRQPARPKRLELCCFDDSRASRRQLSFSFLRAVGVTLTAEMLRNQTAIGLRPAESDAVNQLYAATVVPDSSQLPALVQVGVWQLAPGRKAAEDWSTMIGGRGRRVVAGASRWIASLKSNNLFSGVVGAVPTFNFHGNKAEILLLDARCAEMVSGAGLPVDPKDGLGFAIRRSMLYARSRGFVGGLPTHLDGSLLMLRSPCAVVTSGVDIGETPDSILANHRSAVALANVARWARGHGALYGIPTFSKSQATSKVGSLAMEVILVHPGKFTSARSGSHSFEKERASPITSTLALAGICTAMTFVACRFYHQRFVTQAERDLAFVVDSL